MWRTHLYSAIFAAPILIVMALSGLVIMDTAGLGRYQALPVVAGLPARLSLSDVDRAARQEGLKPGYSIVLPVNTIGLRGA